MVRVKRLPSWICNHSPRKKLSARVGASEYKALIVVDSDNGPGRLGIIFPGTSRTGLYHSVS